MSEEITGDESSRRINFARKLTLLDVIFLVAAAAVALSSKHASQWIWLWRDPGTRFHPKVPRMLMLLLALGLPSLVLLPYQLARPKDRSRLCKGAPGLLVHLVVAVVVAVQLAALSVEALLSSSFRGRPGVEPIRWGVEAIRFLLRDLRTQVVVGVTASWLTLAITGLWNPERAWDDRLGRLIGGLWIIFYLCLPLITRWIES